MEVTDLELDLVFVFAPEHSAAAVQADCHESLDHEDQKEYQLVVEEQRSDDRSLDLLETSKGRLIGHDQDLVLGAVIARTTVKMIAPQGLYQWTSQLLFRFADLLEDGGDPLVCPDCYCKHHLH